MADLKALIDNITDNTNIITDKGKKKNLFNLDSAHDFLFEKSIAEVTTDWEIDYPAGVSGEDRYVYLMQKQVLFDKVQFFGVEDLKDSGKRNFYAIDSAGKDYGIPGPTSKSTSRFLTQIFNRQYPSGANNYFRFQTVHDAGKQLVNTHMPTVSNHIDSAGTPLRDKKAKKGNPVTPPSYNKEKEGTPYKEDEDGLYINNSVMSNNGEKNDGLWSLGSGAKPDNANFRPWFDTKYSLLIFNYIKTFRGIEGYIKYFDSKNLNNDINIFVTNFIWQLTLYFCYKSFTTPDADVQLAIKYLRNVKFTKFVSGRIPYYTLFDRNNPVQQFFNQFFWGSDPVISNPSPVQTSEQPFVVTQAICADVLNSELDKRYSSIIGRNEGGEKVDFNTLNLFSEAIKLLESNALKRCLQIIKFSGDTSHMVQAIIQFASFEHIKTLDPSLPNRITILTTLERILSARMLKFLSNENLNKAEDISVMFDTGVYLQRNNLKLKQLVDKLDNTFPQKKIKYFGVYVLENEQKRYESASQIFDNKTSNISTRITELLTLLPNNNVLNGLKIQIEKFKRDKETMTLDQLNTINAKLSQIDDILIQINDALSKNTGKTVESVYDELRLYLNSVLNLVLHGFLRQPDISKPKNIPRHDAFNTLGLNGELSNLTLNMNHTNPDYDFLSDTNINKTIEQFLQEITILTQYIFDSENLGNKIKIAENEGDELIKELLILLKNVKFKNDTNKTNLDLFNSFDGTFDTFISKDGENREGLKLDVFMNKGKGITIKIIKKGNKGEASQDYNTYNLLILSDKFSMLKDGYLDLSSSLKLPLIVYQSTDRGNVPPMSLLSAYIRSLQQEAKDKLKGYTFFRDFFEKFNYQKKDFTGLIYLIRFFVNSGQFAERKFNKNNKYKVFKEYSDELITILEQLNTIVPLAQVGRGYLKFKNKTKTGGKRTKKNKKYNLKTNKKKRCKNRKTKKGKKCKRKLKHKSKRKRKILSKLQTGGGASNPESLNSIILEILKTISERVKSSNDIIFKLRFFSAQIYVLIKSLKIKNQIENTNENYLYKFFIEKILVFANSVLNDVESEIERKEYITELLAELTYIKLNFKTKGNSDDSDNQSETILNTFNITGKNTLNFRNSSIGGNKDYEKIIKVYKESLSQLKKYTDLKKQIKTITSSAGYYYDFSNKHVKIIKEDSEVSKPSLEVLLKDQIRAFRFILLVQESGDNSSGAEYIVKCKVGEDGDGPDNTLYDYLLFDKKLSTLAYNCNFLPEYMKEIYESYLLNIIEELLKIYIDENDKIIEAVLAAKAAEQERVKQERLAEKYQLQQEENSNNEN